MPDNSPTTFVFCALFCEARPLLKAWRLSGLPAADHPYAVYANRDRVVVVTGMGKINMAGAVGYALALFGNPQSPVLVNLGIAGQRDESPGRLCMGHKIVDKDSGRCFYPQLPFTVPCKTYSVVTACQPNMDYATNEMYEMEAAGFYELALKFSSSELIQVMKVISDSARSPIADINEALVERWVDDCLTKIESIIDQLMQLRQQCIVTTSSDVYRDILEAFHFTVSRSLKLKSLLHRWRVVKGDEAIAWRDADLSSAKELLCWMEQQLDSVDFYL
ncbi:hypothetical protein [Methylomonas sp. MgM2]